MEDEKIKLKSAINELIKVVEDNPCGMGKSLYMLFAMLIPELCRLLRRKRYLSTDEAAKMLGISPRTLRRRVKEGKIPSPRHYGHWEVSYKYEDIVSSKLFL